MTIAGESLSANLQVEERGEVLENLGRNILQLVRAQVPIERNRKK